jgi:hypothetical protein
MATSKNPCQSRCQVTRFSTSGEWHEESDRGREVGPRTCARAVVVCQAGAGGGVTMVWIADFRVRP